MNYAPSVPNQLTSPLRKNTDGLISRHLNRRVSLTITSFIKDWPIHPNTITAITMLIGVASGVLVAVGSYKTIVLGGFFIQLQSMLDGVDGEMARLKNQKTKLGEWLDTISDDVTELSFLIGTLWLTKIIWLSYLGWLAAVLYIFGKGIIYRIIHTQQASGNIQDFSWEFRKSSTLRYLELFAKHDFICFALFILCLLASTDLAAIFLSVGSIMMFVLLILQQLSKKIILHGVAVMVGGLGLIFLLNHIGWAVIGSALSQISLSGGFVLLSLCALEAIFDAMALKQALLARGSLFKILWVNQLGCLANLVLPAESGELVKMGLLKTSHPNNYVSGILIWNLLARFSKPLVLVLLALIALAGLPHYRLQAVIFLLIATLMFASYFVVLLILKKTWSSRILQSLENRHLLSHTFVRRLTQKIREMEHELIEFSTHFPKRTRWIISLQMAARTAQLVGMIILLHYLGMESNLLMACLIYCGLQLMSYLLPLLPTRIGTTEGSAYILFLYLGLNGGLGALIQVIIRLGQLLTIGLVMVAGMIGGIFYAGAGRRRPV